MVGVVGVLGFGDQWIGGALQVVVGIKGVANNVAIGIGDVGDFAAGVPVKQDAFTR